VPYVALSYPPHNVTEAVKAPKPEKRRYGPSPFFACQVIPCKLLAFPRVPINHLVESKTHDTVDVLHDVVSHY
jgi:hypothetical protein